MFLNQQVKSTHRLEDNIEQDQVREQNNTMSSSLSYIVFAVIACLSLCYGYSITTAAVDSRLLGYQGEERQQDNTTSIKLLEAANTDLRRLQAVNDVNKSNSTKHLNVTNELQMKRNESQTNNHDQILGDSSDLLSILTSASDGELLETMPESQRSDSSPFLSMQLPGGQRRFDDSSLALASTGQGWGNKFMMPKTYVSKQHMIASAALQPQRRLSSYDPYFQDNINHLQSSYNKHPVLKKRMGSVNKRPERQMQQQQQQQQSSFVPIEPRDSKSSHEEAEDPFFEEKEPVKAVESDETVGKGFAEGDDIFQDDGQVSKNSNGNTRRSIEDASSLNESDEEDDGANGEDEEEQQNSSPIKARSSQDLSIQQYRNKKDVRKPLRGIEDSSSDEKLESSNIKSKKSNPEVELVLHASAQSGYNKHKDGSLSSSGANFDPDGDEISSGSHIDKSSTDLQAAAGHHHGHSHGHYYQYVEVPKKKAWKMGFKRGNHKHTIMRHEKGYKNKFHSSFKWNAKEKCKKKKKCHSVGKMSWHYEHHEKKKKHHHY